MSNDAELLRRFAEEQDQAAFATLVQRHVDFVHASALRQCRGNAHLAQEVTQQVFIDVSRCAARLGRHPVFIAWLHAATRFAVMNLLRSEARRLARETRAAREESSLRDDTSLDWENLRPVLDEVLGELKDRERSAVLLRFFEAKSLAEVGAALQLSETAARSCVDRALDKMRVLLARRGLTSTSAALGVALTSQPLSAAPSGLAAAITHMALGQSAGAASAASLLLMKKIILVTAGTLLVAELAVSVGELRAQQQLRTELRQIATARPSSSNIATAPTPEASVRVAAPSPSSATTAELLQLQQRIAELKARPAGVASSSLRGPDNLGRATPEAAMSTLAWATRTGDVDALARFIAFSDDTPANRTAFMGNFSEAVRARYATPEQLLIAVNFAESMRDPPIGQQITKSQGYASGVHMVSAWTRYASGREAVSALPFQESAEGWTLTPVALVGDKAPIAWLRSRLDPATGSILPPKK
ncbi:MAG: sigma-70 family RNA polymerase sigma factor [Opitutae bacterium]|nr:sigma-70 family RNA polymerase sigma factor [Opitutae bacterium]